MTADLAWGQSGPGRDALSQPEDIAPAVLYMVSDLAADHTGKVPGVSHARVLEVKMLHTGWVDPSLPKTLLRMRGRSISPADAQAFWPSLR